MFITHTESTLIDRLLPEVADFFADELSACQADGDFSIPVPVDAEDLPEMADRWGLAWSDYLDTDLAGYVALLDPQQRRQLAGLINDLVISSDYEP